MLRFTYHFENWTCAVKDLYFAATNKIEIRRVSLNFASEHTNGKIFNAE